MASWFLPRPFTLNVVIVVRAVADIVHMASKKKVTISWSGGKDSAFALYKAMLSGEYDIVHLHMVFDKANHRVGLHGVHESLIEEQAKSLGFDLVKLYLPESNDHAAYENLMGTFYRSCAREGVEAVVFGDIFLEDLKLYREKLLGAAKLQGIYPIWKIDSVKLIDDFLNLGFKTVMCAANAKWFTASEVGITIDHPFVQSLSRDVDPCGENGEFHTFVYAGPIFRSPVKFKLGPVVSKDYSYRVNQDGIIKEERSSFWFQEIKAS